MGVTSKSSMPLVRSASAADLSAQSRISMPASARDAAWGGRSARWSAAPRPAGKGVVLPEPVLLWTTRSLPLRRRLPAGGLNRRGGYWCSRGWSARSGAPRAAQVGEGSLDLMGFIGSQCAPPLLSKRWGATPAAAQAKRIARRRSNGILGDSGYRRQGRKRENSMDRRHLFAPSAWAPVAGHR